MNDYTLALILWTAVIIVFYIVVFGFKKKEWIKKLPKRKIQIGLGILLSISMSVYLAGGFWNIYNNPNWKMFQDLGLADLCLISNLIGVIAMFSGNQRLIKLLIPIGFLGGSLTLGANIEDHFWHDHWAIWLSSILAHLILYAIGSLGYIMLDENFDRKDIFILVGFLLAYISWILIWGNVTGFKVYSTAVFREAQEAPGGAYGVLKSIGPYPWNTVAFHVVGLTTMIAVQFIEKLLWKKIR